jgi:hypothetical protein
MWAVTPNGLQFQCFFGDIGKDIRRAVGRPVIDDNDFVRNISQLQLKSEVPDRGGNASFFGPSRDYHA